MKKLYLVDVSSMFFRAFFAIPPLNSSKGIPTNALYGFLTMTIKLLREIRPDYIAFCFDRKEKSFRFDLYPEYKANRSEMPEALVPQVPYVKKLTDALGIPRFDKLGFEADDIIGSLAKFGRDHDLEVVIVSGDKDFAQIVAPFISMYDTMKDVRYDEQGVVDKWGVSPKQMIDYLALVGDSSDNIPGVRGIGPKGAQKLLAAYKTLSGIYEHIDDISAKGLKAKLVEKKEEAFLSRQLVTIKTDVDLGISLDNLKLKSVERESLRTILNELDFNTFEKKLIGEGANTQSSTSVNSFKNKNNISRVSAKSSSYKSEAVSERTVNLAQLGELVAPYSEVCAILSERGFFLGCGNDIYGVEAPLIEVGAVLGPKLLTWKGFDLKTVWRNIGMDTPIVPKMDLMLAAYVVRAANIESFDKVYEKYTGKKIPDLASGAQLYHCHLELEYQLLKKLKQVDGEKVLNELELPLVPVLLAMERAGVFVDREELKKQSSELESEIFRLEKEIISLAGEPFNVASPKQLAGILFDKLKLPVIKKTKTGYSTDNEVLQKLCSSHPIAQNIIDYREMAKLKSTYVDALPQLIDRQTGKIHTYFRQAATSTGRLSSVNPNLQNIPIRTALGRKVRKAFLADAGHLLLSADYSQIELRVLAHITKDPALCRAFEQDLDVHAATASEIFNVSLEDVTPELRRKAKAVNFGIAYGQGAYGLAESLGIPRGEATEIIGNYFGKFRGVQSYMERVVEEAKADGYVSTLFGRRRYLDELQSKSGALRKFGERAAINAPIQGTASDLVKMAMIRVFAEVDAKMLLQVHDELLLQGEENEIAELGQEIKSIMESAAQLDVPLKANVAWGSNWDEAHA